MVVIGIDPGLTGALALLGQDGKLLELEDMPVMARGAGNGAVKNQINSGALADMLKVWTRPYDRPAVHAFVELVRPMPAVKATPGKGKGFQITQGSASIFSFGYTAGAIEATLAVLGLQHSLVPAGDWKKALKLGSQKEQARAMAIRLYPGAPLHLVKHHNRAEAILLARYGRGLVH